MNVLTHKEAKLAWANNEALLINNIAENGWEEFFPANWGCDAFDIFQFQIKPKVILIGDIQVPEPIRTMPDKGTLCYFADPTISCLINSFKWKDADKFKLLLERGQLHLIEENAIIHSKALISVSGGTLYEARAIEIEQISTADTIQDNSSEIICFNKEIKPTKNIQKPQNAVNQQVEDHYDHKAVLSDLIDRANNATTPGEANALVKYTQKWSEAERKPLIDAINQRLVKLNQPTQSIFTRIQNAPTSKLLNDLQLEVLNCDAFVQPSLNEAITRRRQELIQIAE